ncbi:uncharacterized protein LOC108225102 isoform X2 [Daucus carota subsp. sativus]|uniref:uncharacterized protein LOC108225102 isoform X2 n=1 Tax=Daucus carota subsp. sativus TaxID=79200 RepID=UPI0007F02A39|nr:PREDICTED: cathepsin L1-like [Daucus carota subsp. sativus]
MADNIEEYRLSKEMPGLIINIFDQGKCQCCWAIAVAGTVGCAYYSDYKIKKHEVSPKDLLDRTWYYYHDLMKGKERDAAGCFRCGLKKAFRVVRDYGIAYLENCPFVPSLDEHKGHLKKTDYPRIRIVDFKVHLSVEEVIRILKHEKKAVVGYLQVTHEFAAYKKGIYSHPPAVTAEGASSRFYLGRHGVVIDGVNESEKYFTIKNSYGIKWGIEGCGNVSMDVFVDFGYPVEAYEMPYDPSS